MSDVEKGDRFVQQEQGCCLRQRQGEPDALLLAAREGIHRAQAEVEQVGGSECGFNCFGIRRAPLGRRDPGRAGALLPRLIGSADRGDLAILAEVDHEAYTSIASVDGVVHQLLGAGFGVVCTHA